MPDFEALIKHQQLKQPAANQRLKVVDSTDFEKEKNNLTVSSSNRILTTFLISFLGSMIGTLTILFLYINGYLSMDLLKIF